MRHAQTAGLLLLLAGPLVALPGCAGDNGSSMGDVDAGPPDLVRPEDLDVPLRPPEPIPMDRYAGRVLASPQLVTITFQGYAFQRDVEAMGDYLMTSEWLAQVGADYGVGPGAHLAKVQLPQPVPNPITDAEAESLIKRYVAMGTLPAPLPRTISALVYLLYVPAHTMFLSDHSRLCDDYVGYHDALVFPDGSKATYAIIGDCELGIGDVTNTASHELIEAATDPWLDSWMVSAKAPSHWALEDGMENADLCWNVPSTVLGGFALTRVWSPSAAAALREPCIPAPSDTFETVVVTPAEAPVLVPGQRVSYVLTGWSSAPALRPWKVVIGDADVSDFLAKDLQPVLSSDTVAHATSIKLTLTVPATANPGSLGGLLVLSGSEQHAAAVAFTTP